MRKKRGTPTPPDAGLPTAADVRGILGPPEPAPAGRLQALHDEIVALTGWATMADLEPKEAAFAAEVARVEAELRTLRNAGVNLLERAEAAEATVAKMRGDYERAAQLVERHASAMVEENITLLPSGLYAIAEAIRSLAAPSAADDRKRGG